MAMASDKKFEDWEEDDYSTWIQSLLTYAVIVFIVLGLTALIMICTTCKVFCCSKWKEAGTFNGERARRGFIACYLLSLVVMLVMAVPAGIGNQMVADGVVDIVDSSSILMHDVSDDLLCGHDDAVVEGDQHPCYDNTVGAYLQYLHEEVVRVCDEVVADVNTVERDLNTSLTSINDALKETNATVANMSNIIVDLAAANTAFVMEMTYLGDTTHTEGAAFSDQLPETDNLPDSDSLTADVTEARNGAEGALEDVDATVNKLDDVTEEMFDEIRDTFGEGGSARGDMTEIVDELFVEVKKGSDDSEDAGETLVDVKEVIEAQSANQGVQGGAFAALFAIVALFCFILSQVCCKRTKGMAFCPMQVCAILCGGILAWAALFSGTAFLLITDLCEEDITLLRTNLNDTFEIGNTTVILGEAIVDVLQCPSIPEDPAMRVPTEKNNLIDIFGLSNEFNVSSIVDDVEDDLAEAKDDIIDMVSDVNSARQELTMMDDAVSMNVSGNFSSVSMKAKLDDLESSLPAAVLLRDDSPSQQAFVGMYMNSPTLMSPMNSPANALQFFQDYGVALSDLQAFLTGMENANPGSVPTAYANFGSWTFEDLESIDPAADADFQTAQYPSGQTYADFQILADAMQAFTSALNVVVAVNAEVHANISDASALLDDIDASIVQLEAEQVQLGFNRDQVSNALDMLDNGNDEGTIYDGVGIIDTAIEGIEDIVEAALEINNYAYCGMFGDWWRSAWEVSVCDDVATGFQLMYPAYLLILVFTYCLLIMTCCFIPEHYLQSTGIQNTPDNPMLGDDTLYGVQSVNQMEMREMQLRTDVKGRAF